MSILFYEQFDARATSAIYNIASSFFEDHVITDYFLTVLGVSLFTTKHEKLTILIGNGRNGKSLIMNYLNSILGDYATVAKCDLRTSKITNGVSCSLVNAKNTRVILVSEPSSEDGREVKLNNTLIKSITGNDRITARALYQNTTSFDPTLNVFMLCNEIPS
jgi:putative DNA primase/helicase